MSRLVGEDILSRLRNNDPSLPDIEFRGLGKTAVKDVADALRSNSHVTTLALSRCEVGKDGAEAMADALRANRSLTQLRLSYCRIGDAEAKAIANSLVDNHTLTNLDVRDNQIEAKGAAAIAVALVDNHTLTKLNLRYNRIGAEGAKALAAALSKRNATDKHAALFDLYLRGNAIGDVGGRAIADMLCTNKTILKLDLSRCNIADVGAKALAAALVYNTTLKKLILHDNGIGDAGAKVLTCSTILCVRKCDVFCGYSTKIRREALEPLRQSLHLFRFVDVDAGNLHEAVALIEDLLPAVDLLPLLSPRATNAAAPYPIQGALAILDRAHPFIIRRILQLTRLVPLTAIPLVLQNLGGQGGGSSRGNADGNRTRIDALFMACRKYTEMLLHTKMGEGTQAKKQENVPVKSDRVPAEFRKIQHVKRKHMSGDVTESSSGKRKRI